MEFNLSSRAVMQEMLAITALRNRSNRPTTALNPDLAAGMRVCVADAFTFVVMRLADVVANVDMDLLDEEPSDPYSLDTVKMRLTLNLPDSIPAGLAISLRRKLESTVAKYALSLTEATSESSRFEELADESIAAIRATLLSLNAPRLSPSY